MDFININVIADKVTRHPLLQDTPFETIIDYTIDFIRIVGTPPSFIEKTAIIDIKNYRGELPCDYYTILHLRCGRTHFNYSNDEFFSSDRFKKHPRTGFTYKIQNGIIITSIENGQLEMAYRAMPIDEEGFPLIPNNSTYTRALELYIKLQCFTMLFDEGKISGQVLSNTQQQYAWAVGQAQTDLIRPTLDQMESITKMWTRLLRKEPFWYFNSNRPGHDPHKCQDRPCQGKPMQLPPLPPITPPEPEPECGCPTPSCRCQGPTIVLYRTSGDSSEECRGVLYRISDETMGCVHYRNNN